MLAGQRSFCETIIGVGFGCRGFKEVGVVGMLPTSLPSVRNGRHSK